MAPNRIMRGGAMPRAQAAESPGAAIDAVRPGRPARRPRPVAAPTSLVVALLTAAALLAGCGGGSSSTAGGDTTAAGGSTTIATAPAASAESADAAILNTVLSRQEAAVGAYSATIPHLAPRLAGTASYLRTQEQEHVDGIVKEMRALKIAAEPKAETIDLGEPKTDAERLVFLYEVESRTIEDELSAIAKLESTTARTLLASTVANQAQHLTLLRRALGAGPLASVPEPFENGTAEPPAS